MALTRLKTSHSITGKASELPRNVLPKEYDIYTFLKFLQRQSPVLSKHNIANSIAKEIVENW